MRTIPLLLAALVSAVGFSFAGTQERPDTKKMMVERRVLEALKPPPMPDAVASMKVAWHASPEAALRASAESGKPILLFHLLGNLDEEFC